MIKTSYIYVGLAALVVTGALVVKAYTKGVTDGEVKVALLWEQEKTMLLRKANEELMKAKEAQEKLQHNLMISRLERQREIDSINAKHAAFVDSLRQRPTERTSSDTGVPEGATAGVGCTGAGLARPDAEFLAGYGADAAKLQSALNSCVAAYNAVKDAVNKQEQK